MSILALANFSIQNHNKQILEDSSFSISNGEKFALIGLNGSGKTSLINYIFRSSKVNTGYAKQDLSEYKGNVSEYLMQYDNWWEISELLSRIFRFEISPNMDFSNLSGGEKMKISICIALYSGNQLVLLDEPTNHLDFESNLKLREFIKKDSRAFVIISHDIDFINEIATKVLEIENKGINVYGGNYDSYREEKSRIIARKQARFENSNKILKKAQREITDKIQSATQRKNRMKKEIKSGNSGIPKIIASGLINKGEGIVAKEIHRLENKKGFALDTMEENRTTKKKQILFKINDNQRRGNFISILNAELKIQDRKLIQDINFEIKSKDRILITGNNGSGKSVLLKNLFFQDAKEIQGKVIYGSEYKTFLLDQNLNILDPELDAINNFQNIVKSISMDEIFKYLFSLNFNLENIKIEVSKLSGGEKLKLIFAILNASDFDLLLLDEPTNNLDIESKEILIEILNQFPGTFVLVSHDKHSINSIDFNKKYKVEDQKLKGI